MTSRNRACRKIHSSGCCSWLSTARRAPCRVPDEHHRRRQGIHLFIDDTVKIAFIVDGHIAQVLGVIFEDLDLTVNLTRERLVVIHLHIILHEKENIGLVAMTFFKRRRNPLRQRRTSPAKDHHNQPRA